MRKILRNMLKNQLETNKIAQAWHQFQLKRYGLKKYQKLQTNFDYK